MTTALPDASDPASPDNGRWGRIPAWWLEHPELDADGFAVLAALATFADENGLCWPSQSTLAGKLKRSRPTINRILQGLGEIGLVTIEHRRGRDGARLSCLYRLRFVRDAEPAEQPARQAPPPSVEPADRDDSQAGVPCPAASQEQLQPEQTPDSLTTAGRGRIPSPVEPVPADWMPSPADLAWAGARFGGVDLGRHVEGFVLRCQAHGYRYRDVGAAWRAWLAQDVAVGKAPEAKPSAPSAGRGRDGAAEQRMNAWMTAAARLQAAASDTRFRS